MRPIGPNRRQARKDANDAKLARYATKKWGWFIIQLPIGSGADWLALLPGGHIELVEVKNPNRPPSARKLTKQELKLFEECIMRNIPYRIVENETHIDRIAGAT